jgi:ANTAR domain-containing protein/GAF domain-containing protein
MTAAAAVHPDVHSAPDDAAGPASPYPSRFVGMAPDLFAPTSLAGTLDTLVGLARRSFGCDGAGVVLTATAGGSAATAASAADVARAEALQVEHHQGPGLDAITAQQPVVSPELRFDSRWRFWAPQAADLGFRSVLSLVLVDGDPFGAVTLYSRRPSFFFIESRDPGLRFAQQASVAIAVAVEREHLLRARDSRGIVGQAQGILMERYDITAEQAFAVLRRYSSHLNQKLRLIAERIVSDRSLPELDLIRFPSPNGRDQRILR